ncbi:restriction endonuclease subunit S [Acetobacteroides hydrogenigenes]|uniref:Type I restriction enzyme S subunit n=1 Tax=Acetobacteroides hydrogenigenes TaxID=979970 RepID=A0A4R2EMI0_9BACT|nr:restriction endonuclease subunit S [Acetobacteroides hydrogenigenes]TCN67674.1 type I restriction enzyme S subunit [Acetobacteroides hydrogenigenes]
MSMMQIKKLFHYEKGSLQSSKCIPGEYVFITASSDWKSHKEYTHNCEALIFAAAASGSLGRTHYVNGKFISSDLCFIITPKDSERYPVDLKFYHLLFQAFKDDIVKNTKAGTSKEAIGLSAFGKYEIPYFDIEKQKETKDKFVNVQGSTNLFTSELNQQLDLVKQLRQAFLREAMQGKLVPQDPNDEPASVLLEKIKVEKERLIKEKKIKKDKPLPPITEDEIPYELPEGWIWCRGDFLAKYIDPHPSHRTPSESKDGVPYVAMKDIQSDGTINFSTARKVSLNVLIEHKNRYELVEGDFIFGKIGTIGKPVKLIPPFNYTLSANVILIKTEREVLSADFLFYYLSSPLAEKFLFENKSTTSYPVFGMGKARLMIVPLPPISEQHRIVSKLDQLMQYCDQLEAGIRQSQQHNEQLLQQVLREALEG